MAFLDGDHVIKLLEHLPDHNYFKRGVFEAQDLHWAAVAIIRSHFGDGLVTGIDDTTEFEAVAPHVLELARFIGERVDAQQQRQQAAQGADYGME